MEQHCWEQGNSVMVKILKSKLGLIFIAYSIIAITISTQNYLIKGKHDRDGSLTSKYGNYLIFKYSYYHLIQGKDLYQKYPEVCGDLFKYSPSFALIFGIFNYFPDFIGLTLWNLLNALLIFFAIARFPKIYIRQQSFILIFIMIELIVSIQNTQSNGLITGLLVFTFVLLERKKYMLATLCIILTVYIKIFGLIAVVLFLFYPGKRKLIFYLFLWFIIFLIMPVFIVGPYHLIDIYSCWIKALSADHSLSMGLSVTGWLQSVFSSIRIYNIYILVMGFLLLVAPLLRIREYKNYYFRLLTLCSILIWVVIFNHKAESPSFILAMSGVGLWFFSQKKSKWNMGLLILAFIFTSLSSTDLVPGTIREEYIKPYYLKLVPCILIWLTIIGEMTFSKKFPEPPLYPNPE
jgi:hypothetical protein